TSFFTDPFARAAGPAKLAAVTVADPDRPEAPFAFTDGAFQVPALDDLVVYELQVEEFYSTFDGVADRLDYLQGLGVNCLELMPVNPIKRGFDWGYGPIGYFAPEDSFGGPGALKNLVNECHARGVALILHVLLGHSAAADVPY